MNEDFVTYNQAVQLKELGFDWMCYTFYHQDNWCGLSDSRVCEYHKNCIFAPTLALTQKWLRDVKGTEAIVIRLDDKVYSYRIYGEIADVTTEKTFDTYEKALYDAIDGAFELVNKQK